MKIEQYTTIDFFKGNFPTRAHSNYCIGKINEKDKTVAFDYLINYGHCRDDFLQRLHNKMTKAKKNEFIDIFLSATIFNKEEAVKRKLNTILPRWNIFKSLKGLIIVQWVDINIKSLPQMIVTGSELRPCKITNKSLALTITKVRMLHIKIHKSAYISPMFTWYWTHWVRKKLTNKVSFNLDICSKEVKKICTLIRSGEIFKEVPCTTEYASRRVGFINVNGPSGFTGHFLSLSKIASLQQIIKYPLRINLRGHLKSDWSPLDTLKVISYNKRLYYGLYKNINLQSIEKSINNKKAVYKKVKQIINKYKKLKTLSCREILSFYRDGRNEIVYTYVLTDKEKETLNELINKCSWD